RRSASPWCSGSTSAAARPCSWFHSRDPPSSVRHSAPPSPSPEGPPRYPVASPQGGFGMAREFSDFEEFFPWYVGQHSKRATRWFHFAGTHLGAATALVGAATRRPALLPAFPVISYSVAWFSHFVIEKNNPASFGHPLWSLRGDVRMLG